MSEYTDEDIINKGSSSMTPKPNEWQVERGYDPIKNPKARFHANGKYATGVYKKWLEDMEGNTCQDEVFGS